MALLALVADKLLLVKILLAGVALFHILQKAGAATDKPLPVSFY
jgi:hypothetical protein